MSVKNDWKNSVLAPSMNGMKQFEIIQNENGTVSFADKTMYVRVGDTFTADELNLIAAQVNESIEFNSNCVVQVTELSENLFSKFYETSLEAANNAYEETTERLETRVTEVLQEIDEKSEIVNNLKIEAKGYAEEARTFTPEGYQELADKVKDIYYTTYERTLLAGETVLVLEDEVFTEESIVEKVLANAQNVVCEKKKTEIESGRITLYFRPVDTDIIVKVRVS